jgi:hypothetical protein
MGAMRLVVDAPGGRAPAEVDVERLGESCSARAGTVSGSTSATPDPPRSPSCTASSVSTSWRSTR